MASAVARIADPILRRSFPRRVGRHCQAIIGRSDADLISVGVPDEAARAVGDIAEHAARRWVEFRPEWGGLAARLLAWSEPAAVPRSSALDEALSPTGVVAALETTFADLTGLWSRVR